MADAGEWKGASWKQEEDFSKQAAELLQRINHLLRIGVLKRLLLASSQFDPRPMDGAHATAHQHAQTGTRHGEDRTEHSAHARTKPQTRRGADASSEA